MGPLLHRRVAGESNVFSIGFRALAEKARARVVGTRGCPGLKSRADGTKSAFADWDRVNPRRRVLWGQTWISIQGPPPVTGNPRPGCPAQIPWVGLQGAEGRLESSPAARVPDGICAGQPAD